MSQHFYFSADGRLHEVPRQESEKLVNDGNGGGEANSDATRTFESEPHGVSAGRDKIPKQELEAGQFVHYRQGPHTINADGTINELSDSDGRNQQNPFEMEGSWHAAHELHSGRVVRPIQHSRD